MIAVRRARTLASAVVLSLAQVTPAVALATPGAFGASGAPAWACSPEDIAAGVDSAARGGIAIREKDTGQVRGAMPATAVNAAPANLTVTVPVWFHVISNGSTGNVTDAIVTAQIAQLNAGFGGSEGGPDTGFSFVLAGTTRTSNATWYASKGGAEKAFKQALKVGGDNTLNVYSTSGGSYLGWAYLPSITTSSQAYLDGVVIDWRTMPGASTAYANQYDEGDTLIHEVGHWLNLEHTFYGGCKVNGDFVADTPPQKSASSGCPVGRDSCAGGGIDPIHNYMDYSDDDCITEFTAGQIQRMADAWVFWRA